MEPLEIVGAPGSPYSRKLRAVLRYRRIPHVWVQADSPESRGLPEPRVALLPRLVMPGPNGERVARTDTTPLIRELERSHPGRAVVPPDPVMAFVDALLEDYADEWLTKAMFHYRWAFPDDVANAAALLPRWRRTDEPEEKLRRAGDYFAERQVGRLHVVGSNPTTAPVIEESYRRLLHLLDQRLTGSRFLLGGRPATCDFALYGQLTQLAQVDPTPRALAMEHAPRVVAWVDIVEDLSGLEPQDEEWCTRDALAAAVRPLLAEVGQVYAPFLLANAEALEKGDDVLECRIDGRRWTQRPFSYQGKCLRALREAYADLEGPDRREVDALLAGSGCEALFNLPADTTTSR